MKYYSIITLLVIGALTMVSISACSERSPWETSPWREDTEPIIKRFPSLDGFTRAKWKGGSFDKSMFSGLGPTGYWMKGYVFLPDEGLPSSLKDRKWDNIKLGIEPSLFLSEGIAKGDWKISHSLNQELLGSKFHGKFYYSPQGKILYFDLFWD